MNTVNKVFLIQILVLSILSSACASSLSDGAIPTTSPTLSVVETNTPVIEETPTTAPTASITPAAIVEPKIHELALNEINVDKVENLAAFGATRENCLISSFQDSAIETRFVNGQAEYLLATTDLESQNIQLWSLTTKKHIQTFNSNDVDSVLFHPDHRTLISFSRYEPGRLTLWDIQAGGHRQEFVFKSNYYYDERISISPDGLRIALFSGSYNAVSWQISEFDLQTNQISDADYDFPIYSETAPPFIYSPKGNLVAITYNFDDKLHFLDLTNHKDTILQFPFSNLNDVGLSDAIFSTISISPNEEYIAGGTLGGDLYVWNFADGALLKVFEAHTTQRSDGWQGAIKSLEFSPESNLLLSVGYDGLTKLWDTNARVLLKELNTCHHFGGFTQDGRYLVTVGNKGIEIWGIP